MYDSLRTILDTKGYTMGSGAGHYWFEEGPYGVTLYVGLTNSLRLRIEDHRSYRRPRVIVETLNVLDGGWLSSEGDRPGLAAMWLTHYLQHPMVTGAAHDSVEYDPYGTTPTQTHKLYLTAEQAKGFRL